MLKNAYLDWMWCCLWLAGGTGAYSLADVPGLGGARLTLNYHLICSEHWGALWATVSDALHARIGGIIAHGSADHELEKTLFVIEQPLIVRWLQLDAPQNEIISHIQFSEAHTCQAQWLAHGCWWSVLDSHMPVSKDLSTILMINPPNITVKENHN